MSHQEVVGRWDACGPLLAVDGMPYPGKQIEAGKSSPARRVSTPSGNHRQVLKRPFVCKSRWEGIIKRSVRVRLLLPSQPAVPGLGPKGVRSAHARSAPRARPHYESAILRMHQLQAPLRPPMPASEGAKCPAERDLRRSPQTAHPRTALTPSAEVPALPDANRCSLALRRSQSFFQFLGALLGSQPSLRSGRRPLLGRLCPLLGHLARRGP